MTIFGRALLHQRQVSAKSETMVAKIFSLNMFLLTNLFVYTKKMKWAFYSRFFFDQSELSSRQVPFRNCKLIVNLTNKVQTKHMLDALVLKHDVFLLFCSRY